MMAVHCSPKQECNPSVKTRNLITGETYSHEVQKVQCENSTKKKRYPTPRTGFKPETKVYPIVRTIAKYKSHSDSYSEAN